MLKSSTPCWPLKSIIIIIKSNERSCHTDWNHSCKPVTAAFFFFSFDIFFPFLLGLMQWGRCHHFLYGHQSYVIIITLLPHRPISYYFLYSTAPQQVSPHTHLYCGKVSFHGGLTRTAVIIFFVVVVKMFLFVVKLPVVCIYSAVMIKCLNFTNCVFLCR